MNARSGVVDSLPSRRGPQSAKGCALVVALGLGLLVTSVVNADGLKEHLEPTTTRMLELVNSEAYAGQGHAERGAAARRILDELFDWLEMARRALGQHWSAQTQAEQQDFIDLFADLLGGSYASMLENAGASKVEYVAETVEGERAVVRTRLIVENDDDVPVDYLLTLQRGRWKANEIIFDDVGMVSNYRAQFNRVLGRNSYAELLARIKQQLKAK